MKFRLADARIHIRLAAGFEGGSPCWTLLGAGDFRIESGLRPNRHNSMAVPVTSDLVSLIQQANIAIINLEGPLCNAGIAIPKSGPVIYGDPNTATMLYRAGFNVVTLANNHIMDYSFEGLKGTLERCCATGLSICGAGTNIEQALRPVELEIAGKIKVSILAVCEREFGVADDDQPGSAWISHPLTLEAVIKAKRESDIVVVVAHGGVEEVPFPPIERQVQLRQLVDAGADLVIGHHSHVPQGWEQYRNGFIFYSLGNFLFDYPNGESHPKTEWGLIVRFHFCGACLVGIDLIPIEQVDGIVGRMGKRRDLGECLHYLSRLAELTGDQSTLAAYWQEIAVRLFMGRYLPYLRYSCGCRVTDNTLRAYAYGLVRALARRLFNKSKIQSNKASLDYLLLLNLLRNESHYWTIKTALSVLSGEEKDLRTTQVKDEVERLLRWTQE
ncbi:MAG: CapA family protein [Candidatus Aminicenantes bacterium]|nr:CapA family protein [Candidatus Aminicenantes bacterium]